MAWTAPRTWTPLETVTAALLNVHVRDNLNLLKTRIDADGTLKTQLFGVGMSIGGPNTGATETDPLPGHTFSLGTNFLANGEFLQMRGVALIATNANAKTIRFRCGAGTAITIWSSALSIANHIGLFDCWMMVRSSTTAAVTGQYYAGATVGATPTMFLINNAIAGVNFAIAQTTRLTGQGGASNDLTMTDWLVTQFRGAGTIR
jgi:hypothetical protein